MLLCCLLFLTLLCAGLWNGVLKSAIQKNTSKKIVEGVSIESAAETFIGLKFISLK